MPCTFSGMVSYYIALQCHDHTDYRLPTNDYCVLAQGSAIIVARAARHLIKNNAGLPMSSRIPVTSDLTRIGNPLRSSPDVREGLKTYTGVKAKGKSLNSTHYAPRTTPDPYGRKEATM